MRFLLVGILALCLGSTALAACPGRNSTINTALAVGQLGETAIDCTETVRILQLPHGMETDPFVPRQVTVANRAQHPGPCMLAGAGVVGLGYAIFRCKSPFYMTAGFVGEAININLNWQVLKGK